VDMINWYAVQAKSHSEGRVLHYLGEKIVPVFLPRIEVIHRYRSRRIARLEPLFPGYLFVQLKPIDCDPGCWNAVRWTPGVKSILCPDGVPVPVPDSVIEAIKTRVQELGFVRPGPRFAVNSLVAIQRGPLAGLEAVFKRPLSSSGRVLVLMHLLGQQRRVQVDAADLELA
jgi:transcriptional antiterminator RfaH